MVGVCKEIKPTGVISVTKSVATNSKIGTTVNNKISTTSTSYNTCGSSSDYNLFESYGVDISLTSTDIYSSATTGDTTYKTTIGLDDKYVYYGGEVEIETGPNESISMYTRLNVRREIVIMAGVTILAISGIAELEAAGATTISVLKEALGVFSAAFA